MSLPPREIPLGAMRFNSDSQKLEYWNGEAWFQIKTFSPNLDGGARGVMIGGHSHPSYYNTIDFVTIASAGNATDFGDLTAANSFLGGASNSIKGIFAGGSTPTKLSTIQSIEIATTGNAVAFGDNTGTDPVSSRGTCSDSHGGLS